jgi:hypothetical protein
MILYIALAPIILKDFTGWNPTRFRQRGPRWRAHDLIIYGIAQSARIFYLWGILLSHRAFLLNNARFYFQKHLPALSCFPPLISGLKLGVNVVKLRLFVLANCLGTTGAI